jgi:hypothetical protein
VPREGAYDSLHEVLNMKTAQSVGCEVDSWIAQEEMPATAQLKVIRQNDPDRKLELKQKIAELTRRIIEAKRIRERYAPWDS